MSIDIGASIEAKLSAKREREYEKAKERSKEAKRKLESGEAVKAKQLEDARARSKAHYEGKKDHYKAKAKAYYAKNKKQLSEQYVSPHNMKEKDKVMRTCLKCDKKFNSRSKSNRQCYDCKQSADYKEHYDTGEVMEQ